jgi:WD40 repeat protein
MSLEDLQTSPFDGEEFVTCSKDCSFAIWNVSNNEPIFTHKNEEKIPSLSVQYHPQNESLLFLAPLDAKIEIWDKEEKKKVKTIVPPDDILFSSMSISQYNENLLAVGDEYGEIHLWDLRRLKRVLFISINKKPIQHFEAHTLGTQVKFNPHDEKLLGSGSFDGFFHLWNLKNSTEQVCLKSFQTHTLPITTWDWSIHDFGLIGDSSSGKYFSITNFFKDYSLFLWNFLDTNVNSKL